MQHPIEHADEIIASAVSGFREYRLTDPVQLHYVSQNLCDMLGCSLSEFDSEANDGYRTFIFPADAMRYIAFLLKARQKEQSCHTEYRLRRKDGRILYVKDTITSKRLSDGTLAGYAVLTDITDLKFKNQNLQFLSENIPCGFIKYTCEKQPKITYYNQQMLQMLRFPSADSEDAVDIDFYQENIYRILPPEEHKRFSLFLNRVNKQGGLSSGDLSVMRYDGTRAHVFGCISKCRNDEGKEEFQSICIDITEQYQKKKEREIKQYVKTLGNVYDKIFSFNRSTDTVKCLYCKAPSAYMRIENIPMHMEDATEKWIDDFVFSEDREIVRDFFHMFFQKRLDCADGKLQQIQYRARSTSGSIQLYNGVLLPLDDMVFLFGSKNISETTEADILRIENLSLKENMQELLSRFADGFAAFEVIRDTVTPLYTSDSLCGFFGYTKEEWTVLMKTSTPVKTFIAHSKITYEAYEKLRQKGEDEFTYLDAGTGTIRHIKAICSTKLSNDTMPLYIMLYHIDNEDQTISPANPSVYIRTFGYFDVFIHDKPIVFRSKKAKELFALLVDRCGGYISSEEAISFLWEDEPINSVTLARYRKVALRLKNTLEEYGISEVMAVVDGRRRIVTEAVRCDLYQYLSGKEAYAQLFKGSYLTNYSWGETTLAQLSGNMLSDSSANSV